MIYNSMFQDLEIGNALLAPKVAHGFSRPRSMIYVLYRPFVSAKGLS